MKTANSKQGDEFDEVLTSDNLPEGWAVCHVRDLFQSFGGGTPNKQIPAYWGGSIPWLSSGDIKTDQIQSSSESITKAGLTSSSANLCRPGSVIVVVRSGILKHTLPVAVLQREAAINQDIKCLDSGNDEFNTWLALALKTSAKEILALNREGTTVQSVKYETLKEFGLLVPPHAEQERIVAKVEALLAEVNRVRARLEKVPKILKAFRQSVLAAACSGRLTEDWREKQRDAESAQQLPEIIQQKLGSTVEPPECSEDLPDSWAWTTIAQLIIDTPQNGLYKPRSDYGSGVPIIRIDDFQDNFVRARQDLLRLRVTREETTKFCVQLGDILINRVNSPSHIGKSLLVTEELCPALFESNMMRFHLQERVDPAWLVIYLRSREGRARLISSAKWAVNQVSINQGDVCATVVPIPPTEEQHEIVRRVEALFNLADTIQKQVESATKRAEKITQAILAKAFRGELVPTEAELARRESRSYEPASVLLARIRADGIVKAPSKNRSHRHAGPRQPLAER